MRVQAVIEIPKGDGRRRHARKEDKSTFVDLGAIAEKISVNKGIMPEHYGFIPKTWNEADGDEVDIVILGERAYAVGETLEAVPFALLRREDGDEKIVAFASDEAGVTWEQLPEERKKLITDFFGSNSPVIAVEDAAAAEKYISSKVI